MFEGNPTRCKVEPLEKDLEQHPALDAHEGDKDPAQHDNENRTMTQGNQLCEWTSLLWQDCALLATS